MASSTPREEVTAPERKLRRALASPYDPPISLRLTAVFGVALLAATTIFVLHDRSRLASRSAAREATVAACKERSEHRGRACGVAQLGQEREGDLLGLPFLVLAIVLALVLVAKVRLGEDEPGGASLVRPGSPPEAD